MASQMASQFWFSLSAARESGRWCLRRAWILDQSCTRESSEVRWEQARDRDPPAGESSPWFQADYGIFYAGKFLKQTQPGRNLNYWALWAGCKF